MGNLLDKYNIKWVETSSQAICSLYIEKSTSFTQKQRARGSIPNGVTSSHLQGRHALKMMSREGWWSFQENYTVRIWSHSMKMYLERHNFIRGYTRHLVNFLVLLCSVSLKPTMCFKKSQFTKDSHPLITSITDIGWYYFNKLHIWYL